MDLGDDVGPRQHQQVVVALQIARMRCEALAAEVGLGRAAWRWIIVPIAPSRTRIRVGEQRVELVSDVRLHR